MERQASRRGPRVPPVVFFAAAIAVAILLHRYLPLASIIPAPWNLLGILPMAAGLMVPGVYGPAQEEWAQPGMPAQE